MVDISMLRDAYRAHKSSVFNALRSAHAPARGVHAVLKQLSSLADEALRALWNAPDFGNQFALVAVGGFGRGELFPYSDVDVLLLLPDGQAADAIESAKLESFIGQCWDAGLEIGSRVRNLDECLAEAAKDVTVQTSLLEARLVAGDKKLFATFRQPFLASIDPCAFFAA